MAEKMEEIRAAVSVPEHDRKGRKQLLQSKLIPLLGQQVPFQPNGDESFVSSGYEVSLTFLYKSKNSLTKFATNAIWGKMMK